MIPVRIAQEASEVLINCQAALGGNPLQQLSNIHYRLTRKLSIASEGDVSGDARQQASLSTLARAADTCASTLPGYSPLPASSLNMAVSG
ncbi:MAG: hypothetical protein Q7S46_04085 [Gallionella sp.]|nr:hypothetical protein [Gallionella sp.]